MKTDLAISPMVICTASALQPKPGGQHGDKDIGIDAVEQHLEDAVEGHQPGGVIGVAFGQLIPDDDHGDAARQPDHDQPGHVFGVAAQEDDRQQEHQDRADDPVLQQRQAQHLPVAEDLAQLVIMHLGQRRVHHQDQADGDGDVGGADRNRRVERLDGLGQQKAQAHADRHGQEDPQGQVAVEKGQAPGYALGKGECGCCFHVGISLLIE